MDFVAAALSITTLYRSSRKNAKRAYNAGYATACQDLLNFIQHGVSAGGSAMAEPSNGTAVDGGGMTIGRVMDWTEARLDAIRAVEEDEDEDEEREREKERGRPNVSSAAATAPSPSSTSKPELRKSAVANAAPSTSRISVRSVSTLRVLFSSLLIGVNVTHTLFVSDELAAPARAAIVTFAATAHESATDESASLPTAAPTEQGPNTIEA